MNDTLNVQVGVTKTIAAIDVFVDLEFDRLPSASVRGNSRLHHIPKSLATKAEKEFGVLVGMQVITKNPGLNYPLEALEVKIVAQSVKAIDGDNLLIGYKPFIDGLTAAGLIQDDASIKAWSIELLTGEPHTKIRIHGRED